MAMVSETLLRSAAQVAEMVRRKEISSRELTEALFARIEAVNPAVNAVVELRPEAALRKAAASDAAIGTGGWDRYMACR
jgi:amidase